MCPKCSLFWLAYANTEQSKLQSHWWCWNDGIITSILHLPTPEAIMTKSFLALALVGRVDTSTCVTAVTIDCCRHGRHLHLQQQRRQFSGCTVACESKRVIRMIMIMIILMMVAMITYFLTMFLHVHHQRCSTAGQDLFRRCRCSIRISSRFWFFLDNFFLDLCNFDVVVVIVIGRCGGRGGIRRCHSRLLIIGSC